MCLLHLLRKSYPMCRFIFHGILGVLFFSSVPWTGCGFWLYQVLTKNSENGWACVNEHSLGGDSGRKSLSYLAHFSQFWAEGELNIWAPSSEFVSSSIPSRQTLTAHAQPFRGAWDLAFCLKVPLDSLLIWASSGGSGETARMRRLAWTFAARIGDKYQIRLTRSI